jgi:uncharacterized protein with PIN domain
MNSGENQQYYFDTNAVVKYYMDEPGSLQISRLVSNTKPILISPLTIVECVGVLMKFHREKKLRKRKLNKILKLLEKNTANGEQIRPFQVVAMPIDTQHTREFCWCNMLIRLLLVQMMRCI